MSGSWDVSESQWKERTKRDANLKFPLFIELGACFSAVVKQIYKDLSSTVWNDFICLHYSFLYGFFEYCTSDCCWKYQIYSAEQNLPFLSECCCLRNTAFPVSHGPDFLGDTSSDFTQKISQPFTTVTALVSHTGDSNRIRIRRIQRPREQLPSWPLPSLSGGSHLGSQLLIFSVGRH